MLALYRADRQAEALDAYAEARRTLVDDLGIEPSEALQRLQQAILRHDPALEAPQGTAAVNGRLPTETASPPTPNAATIAGEGRTSPVSSAPLQLALAAVVLLAASAASGGDPLGFRGRHPARRPEQPRPEHPSPAAGRSASVTRVGAEPQGIALAGERNLDKQPHRDTVSPTRPAHQARRHAGDPARRFQISSRTPGTPGSRVLPTPWSLPGSQPSAAPAPRVRRPRSMPSVCPRSPLPSPANVLLALGAGTLTGRSPVRIPALARTTACGSATNPDTDHVIRKTAAWTPDQIPSTFARWSRLDRCVRRRTQDALRRAA